MKNDYKFDEWQKMKYGKSIQVFAFSGGASPKTSTTISRFVLTRNQYKQDDCYHAIEYIYSFLGQGFQKESV